MFVRLTLHKPWVLPHLIKPPKTQRLPDIVSVPEAQRLFAATRCGGLNSTVELQYRPT
jgi:hypothetical protein